MRAANRTGCCGVVGPSPSATLDKILTGNFETGSGESVDATIDQIASGGKSNDYFSLTRPGSRTPLPLRLVSESPRSSRNASACVGGIVGWLDEGSTMSPLIN